eukprot:Nitzschia sp. Nitz4//scaffold510_size4247//462//3780//NITZ4_009250-RA/size4247-augustus-gene-0.1-mRNA-1//-1//CDS//3329553774//9092//frame0
MRNDSSQEKEKQFGVVSRRADGESITSSSKQSNPIVDDSTNTASATTPTVHLDGTDELRSRTNQILRLTTSNDSDHGSAASSDMMIKEKEKAMREEALLAGGLESPVTSASEAELQQTLELRLQSNPILAATAPNGNSQESLDPDELLKRKLATAGTSIAGSATNTTGSTNTPRTLQVSSTGQVHDPASHSELQESMEIRRRSQQILTIIDPSSADDQQLKDEKAKARAHYYPGGAPQTSDSDLPVSQEGQLSKNEMDSQPTSTTAAITTPEPSLLTSIQSQSTAPPAPVTLERTPVGQRYARPGVMHVPGMNARQSGTRNPPEDIEHQEYDHDVVEAGTSLFDVDTHTIAVEAVTRDDLEDEVHQQIISKAPVGEVVDIKATKRKERLRLTLVSFLCCVGLIVMIVLLVRNAKEDDSGNKATRKALFSFLTDVSLAEFNISDASRLQLTNTGSAQYNAHVVIADINTEVVNTVLTSNGGLTGEGDADLLLEQYALATLYFSTGGNNSWSEHEFLQGNDTCAWINDISHCTDANKVDVLDLASTNLNGTLPSELVFLRELSFVNMSDNSLMGDLGPLWKMDLVSLDVHGNELEDWNMPPGTAQLTLEYLDVSDNVMMRTMPPEIYDFSSLEYLDIGGGNPVQGTLSSRLSELGNLKEFHATGTGLTGTVPSELGDCTNMSVLRLSDSVNITGTFPDEGWLLPKLENLGLSGMGLIMRLPSDLMSQMTTLQVLDISAGRFQGSVPSEIGYMTNLRSLDISSNFVLTGPLPTEIGLLTLLTSLDSSQRAALTGAIPSEIGTMSSLETLALQSSSISGQIPSEIGKLTNLKAFYAQSSPLSTSIPSEIGLMTKLQSFNILLITKLFGTVPIEVENLTNLIQFKASGPTGTSTQGGHTGGLEGTLPVGFSLATNLQELILAWGQINGTIPVEYGQLYQLERFAVDNHQIGGTIPLTFASLSNLNLFSIAHNDITGTFPMNLRLWHSIQKVAIEGNNLSGKIGLSHCDGWPSNYALSADCGDFDDQCICCTKCCVNGICCTSTSQTVGNETGGNPGLPDQPGEGPPGSGTPPNGDMRPPGVLL